MWVLRSGPTDRGLIVEILIQETIDKYGYDPNGLKPKSHSNVVVRCQLCGHIKELQKCYVKAVSAESTISGIIKAFHLENLGIAHEFCNLSLGPQEIINAKNEH